MAMEEVALGVGCLAVGAAIFWIIMGIAQLAFGFIPEAPRLAGLAFIFVVAPACGGVGYLAFRAMA